ncbi:ABC transporter substrate-binding protein [Jiangella asiatica]|uniref:ABC transporter substrate-binding protein n=1 Tax=Jiangella asiatica TaxID=2530372 RepID=A0A4R5CWZ5_9ACTN|nr:ABC transporter substrate-binding protein [Jiangella asiatica]TDE03094.1 ABC transporter substrate-binding protein [Jiangella asiatica]
MKPSSDCRHWTRTSTEVGMGTTRKGNFELTRRSVLAGGAGLAAAWLTGCDLSTDPAGSDDRGGTDAPGGKEAPDLAQRVEAGELPPLEERLPDNPLVIEPTSELGVYGGTWASAITGPGDIAWMRNTVGYDGLMRWDQPWDSVIPNIAESFEMDETGTVYTFVLRAGMKWSDGEPFTADDLVFAYEDILSNQEIPSSVPGLKPYLDPAGNPATLEKVDDHTVRFTFAEPKGVFLDELADPEGYHITACPRHYLEQFHPKYNPDVEQLVAQEGLGSWFDLMERKRNPWDSPELPVVFAWQATTPLSSGSRVVATRNPYYWKTDPEGSQLPYIDQVVFNVVEDTEVMMLQAANGDLNFHGRHFNVATNRPVLAQSRETGDYDFYELVVSTMNEMIIMLNLNHKDPALRALFQNKDFRIGLSHAINRDEMIAAVWQQQGEPWQGAPKAGSDYYDEEFGTQYLEYDVALANQHLDQAGLTGRDGSGVRLRPDGQPLLFNVEVALNAVNPTWPAAMELVKAYWAEVGVRINVSSQDRTIWTAQVEANDHDACVWNGAGGLGDELSSGFYYLPFHQKGSRWAMLWSLWYVSNGRDGEEPPEHAKRQLELYDQLQSEVDADQRAELFKEIIAIAKEQFYVIGTAVPAEGYGIVANSFHNVPESMPSADRYATPGPTRPEQYYIADS